jgi:hypothetical protein
VVESEKSQSQKGAPPDGRDADGKNWVILYE